MHDSAGMTEVQCHEDLVHVDPDVQVGEFVHDVFETDGGQVLEDQTRRLAHAVLANVEEVHDVGASWG